VPPRDWGQPGWMELQQRINQFLDPSNYPAPGGPGVTPPTPTVPGATARNGPNTPAGFGSGTGGATRSTGASAFTKRSRPATTASASWEYWWARNRYRFLESRLPARDDSGLTKGNRPIDPAKTEGALWLRNKAIETLRLFLDADSPAVRRGALVGLGKLSDEASFLQMLKALKDRDLSVRRAAILTLGLTGMVEAREALLSLVHGGKEGARLVGDSTVPVEFRCLAELSLALAGFAEVGPDFMKIASDDSGDDAVRAMALEGLGLLGGEEAIRFLIDFSRNTKNDYRLMSVAVTALGKTGSPLAVPHLVKQLDSRHGAVRQSAAMALGLCAPKKDTSTVKKLYVSYNRATDASFRGFALASMGEIGGATAIEYLKSVATRGRAPDLPWAALGLGFALATAPEAKVPALLLKKFDSCRNRSTRGALALALGLARCTDALETLTESMHDDDDPFLRGYCALAMGMIGDPSVVMSLRGALIEQNIYPLNTHAALALALLDDRYSSTRLLDRLICEWSETTKAMASRSLVHMGNNLVASMTARRILDFVATKTSDEITYMYLLDLLATFATRPCEFRIDRVAGGSNYLCEHPVMVYLVNFGPWI